MITEQFVIGIDDTDTPEAGGTGRLVRDLAAHAEAQGWGQSLGVTRHELARTDKVPCTAHNFSYALVLSSDRSVLDLEDDVVDFLRERAERGSDPGLAMMSRHSDMPHVLAFGRRAKAEVMRLDWAQTFAVEANVTLRSLGGERRGAIGALAAAGLRGGGNDGRFIELRGIREIEGRVTAGQLLERTAIDQVLDERGDPLDRDDLIETENWVRPRLEGGKAVYRAAQAPQDRRLWLPVDRRPAQDVDG